MIIGFATKGKVRSLVGFQGLIACAGLFFSLRQLWLQTLPLGKAPACMPGLDVLILYFPWQSVAKALLWGSGDCAKDVSVLYGLPMPVWSALYFLLIALSSFVLLHRTKS
jgi:disulfide bond formation protein DsbB